jgi:uncharacterized RDD family membrane protein YckC
MLYEDRMAVATPEGVTLEFTLAGVGSRFVAALLDVLVQGALLIAVAVLTAVLRPSLGGFVEAFAALAAFLIFFAYDIAFETLASGRTLGKRWTGLRVVRVSGAPVGFVTSAVRNLLRLVDILPTAYLVGIITILATGRNQRLGDLAAGTIVVRERQAAVPGIPSAAAASTAGDGSASGWAGWTGWTQASGTGGLAPDELAAWDVSSVTAEEVAAVRQFLARRASLVPAARVQLGRELAGRLRPKVVGPPERIGPENFLEALVAAKTNRP